MLAAAVFLIGLHLWSYQSGRAYQDDRFSAAREGYQGQMAATAHGPERWVADYNLGTTLLAQGWLDTGVDYLQRAMERVPRATEVAEGYLEAYSYECRVRTNLALGLEAQGDVQTTAREWSQAVELYERSSDLLGPCQAEGSGQQSGGSGGQSGGGQQSGQSGQSGDAQTDPGEQAGSAKDRVDRKAQDARDRAEGREPSPSPSDGSGGSGSGPDEADAPGSPGSSSPEPSPSASTPDPFAGETEAERERREQLEDRLRGSDSDQEDDYDQNRPGLSNGGW
jgi:Ca-activated chloride channel family protein